MKNFLVVLFKRALPVFAALILVSCADPGDQSLYSGSDKKASLFISIPGLKQSGSMGQMSKAVASGALPDELTSLMIEVLDKNDNTVASAELVGTDGSVTLKVVAGNSYVVRGTGMASDEILFQGESRIDNLKPGQTTKLSLTLEDKVEVLLSNSQSSVAAGAGPIDFNVSLSGLKNTTLSWYVNGVQGGSAELGFISDEGQYTPPASLPADTQLTIKAEPQAAPFFAQETVISLLASGNTNTSPIANAGLDQSVFERASVLLDGTASSDAENNIASYAWVQTVGAAVTLDRNDAAQVSFTAPQQDDGMTTTLRFELTVTDNEGLTATDDVQIVVRDLPNISIADISQNEGDAGQSQMEFTISRTSDEGDVSVQFSTQDGTASSGSDYVAASGSVTFSSGSLTQTVSVNVNGDTDVEADETFLLNLSGLNGNAEFLDASATATVLNDDVLSQPPFDMTLAVSNYDPNGLNPFTLSITFPELVTGFDGTDITLSNATLSSLTTSDNVVFQATIQPSINGTVTVNIPQGGIATSSGSINNAANELRLPFFDWVVMHPSPSTADLQSIGIGAGRCVIGGQGGNVSELLSSSSSLIFQRSPIKPVDPSFKPIWDIAYTTLGGGLYIAPGSDGFYTSSDSRSWVFNATVNSIGGEEFYAIAEGVGADAQPLLLAVGNTNNQMSISRDGLSWSDQDYSAALLSSEFVDFFDVLWDGSRFVAVGSRFQFISISNINGGSIILTSPDGVNWTTAYRSYVGTSVVPLLGITLGEDGNGNPRWLAVGANGTVVTSSDGINWSEASTALGSTVRIEAVKWSVDRFIAVGSDSASSSAVMFTSANGIDWTAIALPADATVSGSSLLDVNVCPGQGSLNQDAWLAVGKQGMLLSSTDGANWAILSSRQFTGTVTAYSAGNFLQLAQTQNGSVNTLYTSPNGFNWSASISEKIIDLSFIDTEFFAITRDTSAGNWALKASSDGVSWAERINVPVIFPYPESLLKITNSAGSDVWVLGSASDNNIYLSADGMSWNSQALTTPLDTAPAVNGAGNQLIAAINNQLVSSDNGIDWNAFGTSFCAETGCDFSSLEQVLQFGDRYLVRGENYAGEGANSIVRVSDDNGQSWSPATTVVGSCFGSPRMSIAGDVLSYQCGDQLHISHDGVNWVEILAPFVEPQLKYINGAYRLFGGQGGIMSEFSPDD